MSSSCHSDEEKRIEMMNVEIEIEYIDGIDDLPDNKASKQVDQKAWMRRGSCLPYLSKL